MRTFNLTNVLAAFLVFHVVHLASVAQGTTLFLDTFNRDANRNIDALLTGITDNTGSSLPANGVYTHAHIDPANDPGPQDGVAANGGGAQILANELQLAVGAGTSNAFVNHNFTNALILANGNFTVSVDVLGYQNSDGGFGGAFAIGMSQAEAAATGDAFDGATRMTGAYGTTIGNAVPAAAVADFWLAIRGNNSLVWGSNTGNILGVTGLAAKTGTISATFTVANFNVGSTVGYEVFLNGTSQATGSFVWSGTNENYVGLDARDAVGVRLDNFSITTVPEPCGVVLAVVALMGVAATARQRKMC